MFNMLTIRILMLSASLAISSGQIFSLDQIAKIEDFVTGVMQCVQVPGLTLAVVKGNQTWTHGFGFADLSQNRTVNSSTLFGIGSITKAFTTTLLAMNIEKSEDRYKWTTKVVDILGKDFKLIDDIRTKEATLRDILSHRTGLLAGNIGHFSGFSTNLNRQEMTRRLRYLDEAKPFRDAFIYNNWMYGLAGYITEVMSGMLWEEGLKAWILQPLNMMDTRIIGYDVTVTDDNIATPYVMVNSKVIPSAAKIYKIHPGEPGGSLASSADDMSKWIRLMLNKGNTTDGQQLVDWQTLQDAFKPHITLPSPQKKPVFPIADINQGYGYGWFVSNHDGYKRYWHSGGLYGYFAMLWIFPDLDIGFFSSCNGPATDETSKVFSTIFSYLFDIIMDNEPWLNKTTACTYPSPWVPNPPNVNTTEDVTNKPLDNVQQYEGEYGHMLFGDIQITAEDDMLYFSMKQLKGFLHTTKNVDSFKLETTGDFAFLTQSDITYRLVPVTFADQNAEQIYESLSVEFTKGQRNIFRRGVKWDNSYSMSCGSYTCLTISYMLLTNLYIFIYTTYFF